MRTLRASPASFATVFATKVDAFLAVAQESQSNILNVSTQIAALGERDARIPVSVNFSEPGNAWVCSPYTAYGRYSIEEVERWGHPWLTMPLAILCRRLGDYLWRSHVDHCVAINNWLLSTNLFPALDVGVLRRWIDEALARWPGHALWFRSLNRRYTPEWIQALIEAGFMLIPSRQVYLYDRIEVRTPRPHNLSLDLELLRKTPLTRSEAREWTPTDFEHAARLYAQLYLEKYSRLNPRYTARFLRSWYAAGLLELVGFRHSNGHLQAVLGLFAIGDTITAPIVGYATERPRREGLYRLLMAEVYANAAQRGHRVNLSAGAAQFKRLRGGIGSIEYSAVYARHLPRQRRRALQVLGALARHVGEPCMRHFKL